MANKIIWILLFVVSWPLALMLVYFKFCYWYLFLPFRIANAAYCFTKQKIFRI